MILPPKLVLFDLDDTLCDHDRALRIRLRRAFRAVLGEPDDAVLDAAVDASVSRAIAGTEHFAEILMSHGLKQTDAVAHAIEIYLSDRYFGLELFSETLDVIDLIKRRATVGIITNGPSQIQRDKVIRLRISELFSFILISEEEGISKPDPVIFQRALELGNATPAEAIFVGDSPENDIVGAQAAGLTSVWMNRRERVWPGGTPADHVIQDLRELLPIIGIATADSAGEAAGSF